MSPLTRVREHVETSTSKNWYKEFLIKITCLFATNKERKTCFKEKGVAFRLSKQNEKRPQFKPKCDTSIINLWN